MPTTWLLLAFVLFVNTILALAVAALLLRAPSVPGRAELGIALLLLAEWAFCYAMITLSPSLEAKHFWLKLENVGIVAQPVVWFAFTLKYTHLGKADQRGWLLPLWVIPAISLALLFSKDGFDLYYSATQVASPNGGPLAITRGPWYWPQLVQTYILYVASTLILLRWFLKNRFIYRRRLGWLVIAVLVPWVFNIAYQVALSMASSRSTSIDITPVTFTVSAILIQRVVSGLRLFELLPIARDLVMEHIPEMVVVVDARDRVLDANHVARKWLGKTDREIIGQDPMDVFRAWPQLVSRFLLTHETHEEIQVDGHPPRTLELIVTPIYNSANALQGRVIVAHDVTDRKILEDHMQRANESLRTQLAEIESLRAKLEEQAIRDPLTGAFNRRFFSETLDKEVARAAREGRPLSVVILDLDRFKRFNDTYGHKCGDVMLQSLANFLSQRTRGGDVVCRYGGEEFVILMPGSAPETAFERADAWREEYQALLTEYRGHSLSATFSAGAAGYPQHGADGEAVLHAADHALYQSKREGRNRATLFVTGSDPHQITLETE